MIVSAVQIQNLLYVVGALGVATVVSALIVLRHRKPKSLEAGIESFSRELKALAPERRPSAGRESRAGTERQPSESPRNLRARPIVRSGASRGARHSPVSAGDAPSVTRDDTDTDDDEASDGGDTHRTSEDAGGGDQAGHETGGAGRASQDSSAPAKPVDPVKGSHFRALDGRKTDTGG